MQSTFLKKRAKISLQLELFSELQTLSTMFYFHAVFTGNLFLEHRTRSLFFVMLYFKIPDLSTCLLSCKHFCQNLVIIIRHTCSTFIHMFNILKTKCKSLTSVCLSGSIYLEFAAFEAETQRNHGCCHESTKDIVFVISKNNIFLFFVIVGSNCTCEIIFIFSFVNIII